ATPNILNASARFGVKSISRTISSKLRISSTDDPISVSSGKTIIPSTNSDGINLSSTLNSCREQIIPFDSIPRNLTFFILKLPGKRHLALQQQLFDLQQHYQHHK